MVGYLGKSTNRALDVAAVEIQSEREDQWGSMSGRVTKWDPKRQVASIQPLYKKRLNGKPTDLPVLEEVPVRFHRMGGFVITTPVKEGDLVELRPQMRNTENFHGEGGAYEAADARSFSLSDMEAYPIGGESLSDPISNFNNENMEIRSADGKHKLEFSEDGKFKIDGGEGNVYTIIADALRRLANAETIVTQGSSVGLYTHDQKGPVLALADLLDGMAL